ncbi:Gp37-like protein [Eubacterium maltosivorans]|uniref:Gp37-like protein n=1 Tax=Eubacterium maltosivorans TaxID=2041044 RepID=UPI003A92A044
MKPIIRVYDKDLRFLGEIHDASSVIWTKRWSTYGDFEIHLDKPDPLFENGNYVMLNHDPYKCGVIEYDQDDGDGYQYNSTEDYVVKGYSLLFLLYHRITVPTSANDGYLVWNNKPAEDIMYELVDGQVIHPLDTKRVIPHFEAAANQHRGKKMTFRSRLKYLPDELYELSIESGLGVAVRFDPVSKRFIFEVLEGVDRRRTGLGTEINPNSYIFSRRNRKVKKHTYTHDTSSFKNMAYIGGQGDGDDRTIVTIYDDLSGLNRREAFIDARDIADEEENENTNTALVDRGKTKLTTDFREVINYEYEAETEDYMVLWDLGDTCTYIDDKKQITLHQQVTEVQETHEDGQLKIDPTFGYTENSVSKSLASVTQATIVERTGISAKFTQLYADYAEIQTIVAGKADIQDLTAMNGKITNLEAGIVTITGNLNAAVADITTLKSNYVEVNKLVAEKASIESLNAVKAHIEDLEANIITVDQLNATNARVDILEAGNVTITGRLDAAEGHITDLTADNVTINGKLTAAEANIGKLTADLVTTNELVAKKAAIEDLNAANAKIEKLEADIANVGDLSAITADIGKLKADVADIDTAMIGKADIDLANIKNGCITTAMIGTGVIGTTQIADGSITDAKIVGLTANKITAGRLDAAQIEVVNLNAANITVGTINGVQIAPGAIDLDKLSGTVSGMINGAVDTANNAQITADGKNKIYYQNTQPGLTGNKKGDTWFDTANGYKAYVWDGTKWSASPFGSSALSDAVNSSITTAGSNASTALANAVAAKTAADQAAKDAQTAQSNASAAKAAADQAAKDLETAEKNLAAVTGRVDATEEEIAAAQSAVTTAQNKANAAAQAAATAQSTADTAKQNAATAQTKADSAYSLADQAKKAAATAQTSADGKNTVFYQTTQPPTTGRKTGDTWFDTDDGNRIYRWDGSKWTAAQFGTNAIANAAITNALIADATIQSAKIAALDAAKITTGILSADRIAAGSIVFGKLDGSTQGTINTAKDNANAALLLEQVETITGSLKKFKNVCGYTNDVANLKGYLIITTPITPSRMVNVHISGYNYVSVNETIDLRVGFYNYGSSITSAGYVNNGSLQFSSIKVAKVSASDTRAVIIIGSADTVWQYPKIIVDEVITGYSTVCPDSYKDGFSATITATLPTTYVQTATLSGSAFKNEIGSLDSVLAAWCYNNDKTYINGGKIYTGSIAASQIAANAIIAGKIAANAVTASTIVAGAVTLDKLAANSVNASKIVAGSITAAQLAANTITGDKIAATTIAAGNLAANSVTSDKIVADAVTTAKIAAKAVTANEMAAGSITASNAALADACIVTAKIADGAITNAKIANATIQSAKIAALDAGKITSGYISAARIQAKTLTADKLNISTLSALTANLGTVTAGVLQSGNYSAGNAGMKIDLTNGTVDLTGNITSANATYKAKFNSAALSFYMASGNTTIGSIAAVPNDEGYDTYGLKITSGNLLSLRTGLYLNISSGYKVSIHTDNGASLGMSDNIVSLDGTIYIQNKTFLDRTYPVGSIYMSVNSTSPATLFGGTWVEIQGRFLLGRSSSYGNGSTGGAASVAISTAQMPSHGHTIRGWNIGANGALPSTTPYNWIGYEQSGWYSAEGVITKTGSGSAHDNMPPYLAVYMWKRTA